MTPDARRHHTHGMRFRDRTHAGRLLAALPALHDPALRDAVVAAIPRGGIPVALPLAQALGVPVSTIGVRKVGAPDQPEYAMGAVAEGGVDVVDAGTVRALRVGDVALRRAIDRAHAELTDRATLMAAYAAPADLRGRAVVVVDDGLATGLTDLAAVRALRARGAERVVLAAPVASRPAVRMLQREADAVVCVLTPAASEFAAVGRWYVDFDPVADDEALALLTAAAATARG